MDEEALRARILDEMEQAYAEKEELAGTENMRTYEKALMLQILDTKWKEHLADMDYLRQGIHLRGYAQKNPKQEYKRESFEMFERLLEDIKQEFITVLTLIQVRTDEEMEAYHQAQSADEFEMKHEEFTGFGDDEAQGQEEESHTPYVRDGRKVGRNEPCPCGSGKKYKQCHGKIQ